jgi:hypothetical protein
MEQEDVIPLFSTESVAPICFIICAEKVDVFGIVRVKTYVANEFFVDKFTIISPKSKQ